MKIEDYPFPIFNLQSSIFNLQPSLIRDAQLQKIPYMLIIGDKELEAGAVAVRLRSGEDLGAMPLEGLRARIMQEVVSRE